MLAAVIDNGSTWLLNINDNMQLSNEQLLNEWQSRYVGWLVNANNMSGIMNAMPVTRYLLKDSNGKLIDINFETAYYVYEELHKVKNNQNEIIRK